MSLRRLCAWGGILALSACAAPPPLYSGLTRTSYGPLTPSIDVGTRQPITPPSCDPDRQNAGTHELARQITGQLFQPLTGVSKVDDTVIKEDLQGHFLMPGDPGGHPLVSILDRDRDGIVFWFNADLVSLGEIAAAANEYCTRLGRMPVYEGSARKCSEPKLMPVAVNGKRTMIETYAISSFRCTGGEGPTPSSATASPAQGRALLRDIQRELIRLRLYSGGADGVLGPGTRKAIEAYQRSSGAEVTGQPSPALLQSLRRGL